MSEKSRCKGPEAREDPECWGNSKAAAVNEGEGARESGQETRAERKRERIVPGLVGCSEDFAFTPNEVGATGGL